MDDGAHSAFHELNPPTSASPCNSRITRWTTFGSAVVVVRDHGRWAPVEDFNENTQSGKLLFDLYGNKLRVAVAPCSCRKLGPIIYS
jgi:hypothetical protein